MNLLDIAIAKKMGGGGGSEPTIEVLSVTENGTYTAPSGVDGYNPVTVNVSGGGGIGTLLHTESLGLIQCSSASATNLGKTITVNDVTDYDLLILEISADNKIADQHQGTASFIGLSSNGAYHSDLDGNKNRISLITDKINYTKDSSGNVASTIASAGIYSISATLSNGTIVMPIYAKYNSSSGTINDTYTARVYGVNLYELL